MAKIDTFGAKEDQEDLAVGGGFSRRWRLLHRNSTDLPPAQETDRVKKPERGRREGGSLQVSGVSVDPFHKGRHFLALWARKPKAPSPRQESAGLVAPPDVRSRPHDDQAIGRDSTVQEDHAENAAVRWVDRHVVARQIFIRTDGRVRFFTLSKHLQLAGLAGAAVVGLIFFSAGLALVVQDHLIGSRDQEILQQEAEYDDLLNEVGEYHRQFSRIARNLEGNQATLLSLLETELGASQSETLGAAALTDSGAQISQDQEKAGEAVVGTQFGSVGTDLLGVAAGNASLRQRVQEIRDVLSSARADRAQLDSARAELGERLALTEDRLSDADRRNSELQGLLSQREGEVTELQGAAVAQTAARRRFEARIATLEGDLVLASAREGQLATAIGEMDGQLTDAQQLQDTLQSDYAERFQVLQSDFLNRFASLQSEFTTLRTHSAQLEAHLDDITNKHVLAVQRLGDDAEGAVKTIEKTVVMTGLDADALLTTDGATSEQARGGPYVMAFDSPGADMSSRLEMALGLLDLRVERWKELQQLLRAMPLAPPFEQFTVTSSFGTRFDPINGRTARHEGMDFRGQVGTSVYATAPGRVAYAGWKGAFGRFVEIDHGYGIRSRYAHLNQILVKAGEMVTNRQKIGNLGTSGRSTGPHVHYEIVFNGVHQDPAKFLTAGKHVFKD